MAGETELNKLLKTLKPTLNAGDYVFCNTSNLDTISLNDIVSIFKEQEGYTIIIEKGIADKLAYTYSYTASWITLTVHSSLEAVGLTAAFSSALSENGISCNVVAAYYHDHIFIDKKDAGRAMEILEALSN